MKAGKEVPDSITLVPKQTRTLPNSDFRSSFISSIETKQTFRKKSQSETDDLESSTTPSTGLENEILTPGLTPTPVQPEDDDNQKILNAEIEVLKCRIFPLMSQLKVTGSTLRYRFQFALQIITVDIENPFCGFEDIHQ